MAVSGIPALKNIPGLGYLFKGDSKSKEFEDILIFITPTILKSKDKLKHDVSESNLSPEEVERISVPSGNKRASDWLKKEHWLY